MLRRSYPTVYSQTKALEDMRRPQKRSKTKKKTALASADKFDRDSLEQMAQDARYKPSPYHKSDPAAWGLSGPPQHRPDKTVCEGSGITCSRDANELLKSGFRCGLVSEQQRENGLRMYGRLTSRTLYTRPNFLIAVLVNTTGTQ